MKVHIKGYRIQTNHKPDRICEHACREPIAVGQDYVRVMRLDDKVEIFDKACFESEFGTEALPKLAR